MVKKILNNFWLKKMFDKFQKAKKIVLIFFSFNEFLHYVQQEGRKLEGKEINMENRGKERDQR